jgi:hypothetical protein
MAAVCCNACRTCVTTNIVGCRDPNGYVVETAWEPHLE